MNNERIPMKRQDKDERIKNFKEVELGYSKEEALQEANRCLHCKIPKCVEGCPVKINIPEFIKALKENDIKKSYEIISSSSLLPAICGRVCPQEKQCEAHCIRGIKSDPVAIGALERYVADEALKNSLATIKKAPKKNQSVAIIGSGPSGLSCAGVLAKEGYQVTIYEALHKAGGVLTYGIPEFRLPKKIVEKEISSLKKLGVSINLNVPIGNALTINDLKEKYDAIFIGTGAGVPKFMNIEGGDANEVFAANEILTRINLMSSYKENAKTPIKKGKIAYVIGGGNVAMDAVRILKRLGIDAHLMYRRSEEEIPARKVEVEHAKEEGIKFHLLENPVKILTNENNNVIGMEVVNMELLEKGEDGRRKVREIKNSNHIVNCDMVVMALGTKENHEVLKESNIKVDDRGLIIVNNNETSQDNVYAGGDAVTGAATVILAMEAGKNSAREIIKKFESK